MSSESELEAERAEERHLESAESRKAARTERLRKQRMKEETKSRTEELKETLGDSLAEALFRYLGACAPERITPIERAMAMIGYSADLKRRIVRAIETNPAMEETFLFIAERAYQDGIDSVEPAETSWDNYY